MTRTIRHHRRAERGGRAYRRGARQCHAHQGGEPRRDRRHPHHQRRRTHRRGRHRGRHGSGRRCRHHAASHRRLPSRGDYLLRHRGQSQHESAHQRRGAWRHVALPRHRHASCGPVEARHRAAARRGIPTPTTVCCPCRPGALGHGRHAHHRHHRVRQLLRRYAGADRQGHPRHRRRRRSRWKAHPWRTSPPETKYPRW